MIQRVQSVYLFLVVVFSALFIFLPIGYFQLPDTSLTLKIWDVPEGIVSAPESANSLWGYSALILAFGVMILSIFTTFQFRNRLFQIKLGKFNMLLHVMIVVATFFFVDGIRDASPIVFSYGMGVIFPLLSMVFILMANRAIRSDENKVRAADRIR